MTTEWTLQLIGGDFWPENDGRRTRNHFAYTGVPQTYRMTIDNVVREFRLKEVAGKTCTMEYTAP